MTYNMYNMLSHLIYRYLFCKLSLLVFTTINVFEQDQFTCTYVEYTSCFDVLNLSYNNNNCILYVYDNNTSIIRYMSKFKRYNSESMTI